MTFRSRACVPRLPENYVILSHNDHLLAIETNDSLCLTNDRSVDYFIGEHNM
jgi:hypothetical protein